ncbi:PREDICTED: putative F-box/LRR-repeat protein 19 [Camelina sativa]|uniref:F-box/LRR-repeat protein 19 n=1 Tax=Camelina sativa TaxID=90675 RepID=A0ABM0W9P7_CAMSA|nr:PREDICTED: putative F-box/LRR-repeat protein 19 [Camelina sativa]
MNEAHLMMNDKDDEGKIEEMGSGLGCDWAELNKECLIDIFTRLSLENRWIGPMLVCKPWMDACDDPSLNSVFDLETWFESNRRSNIWYSFDFEQKVDSFLRCVVDRSQGGLKEIRVRHCSDLSVSYAAERCPNLEVIWIRSCLSVTDASIAKIAANCPKLRELDISNSIEISQKALKMVERSCKNVKILMEPPDNVRLSQEEANNYGLSVRSITSRDLLEHIRQMNIN